MRNRSLLVLLLLQPLLVAATTPTQPVWKYEEVEDAMTSFRRPIASVTAEDNSELVLKCDKPGRHQVYALIISPTYLGGNGLSYETRRIMFRFDQDPPIETYWKYQDSYALSSNDRDSSLGVFLTHLRLAQTLKVRLQRYDRATLDTSFSVAGASAIVDKVFVGCQDFQP